MSGEHPCWSYCTTPNSHGWLPPLPTLEASEDEDDDDVVTASDDEDDGDASSPSADEIST